MITYFGSERMAMIDHGRILRTEILGSHEEPLVMFDRLLRSLRKDRKAVRGLIVDRGPDGFSAVRRRVATVTALAIALDVPLATVSGVSPEEAAALPTLAFRKHTTVKPLYNGAPNITVSRRKRLLQPNV